MARTHSSKAKKRLTARRIAVIGAALAATALTFEPTRTPGRPKHTSILTGEKWLKELLAGNDDCFYEQLGVSKFIFRRLLQELQLCCGLCNSRHISADEQLAIFLHFAQTSLSSRMLQERFQRSGDTITRYFFNSDHLKPVYVSSRYIHVLTKNSFTASSIASMSN